MTMLRALVAVLLPVALAAAFAPGASAQDAGELEAEQVPSDKLEGEHPLAELMRTRTSRLRPELAGEHPRVYVTAAGLEELRQRARTTHRDLWQLALRNVRALKVEPPPAPAQERRAQNEVGLAIAEAAFAYKIEGDKKYLAAARKFLDAAVSYDVWGYRNNKPDVDLAAGHLLYGMGWAYDLLYEDLSALERARYRDKLTRQARKMFEHFKPQAGKTYAYSQNHTFIPIAGLGIAAYALYGEAEDAPQWAALARAIFDRVLATYSTDGYFYEGFEYWIFSTPWLIHYLDAHAHATGEDLYDRPGFRLMHKYVAHSMLPGAQHEFDFGDIWEGPETRAKRGKDYARSRPGGRFGSNYNLLHRMASRFDDGDAQGVAQWLESAGHSSAEPIWSLIWYDATLVPVPIVKQQPWHYFPDHEVVYWRSDWSSKATALAFKCGPPEGHHTAPLLEQFPDWRLSAGHAHPDANSFIVYANGAYLTGDSGYAGVPLAAHHNTVLVNGQGQANEGKGHDPWKDFPYARLDLTKLVEVALGPDSVRIRGDATASYRPELGLTRFERRFEYSAATGIRITDTLEAEEPVVFTSLIHADDKVVDLGDRRFRIDAGDARLAIEVIEPGIVHATIVPNELTAPGPPGSVDKGEKVVRGQRLELATEPVTSARFVLKLAPTWQRAKRSK